MDGHHPFYLSGLLSGKCPDLFINVLFNLVKSVLVVQLYFFLL